MTATCTPGLPSVVSGLVRSISLPALAPERSCRAADFCGAPPGLADTGGAPQKSAALQLLSGANAGREMDLTKPLTTLGKPGVQVAVITRRPQGFFITHVEGASFPVVNGKPLDAQAHALN